MYACTCLYVYMYTSLPPYIHTYILKYTHTYRVARWRKWMAPGCRLLVSQHGLANPAVVRQAFEEAGFRLTILAQQQRVLGQQQLDAIFPGLFDYQLQLATHGRAELEGRGLGQQGRADSSEVSSVARNCDARGEFPGQDFGSPPMLSTWQRVYLVALDQSHTG